jgi:serine/threonine protein kinase
MIMKLYGLNLAQLAESHQDGKLPLFKCCRYATQICKAMAGLHRQNILSLDLKVKDNFLGGTNMHPFTW